VNGEIKLPAASAVKTSQVTLYARYRSGFQWVEIMQTTSARGWVNNFIRRTRTTWRWIYNQTQAIDPLRATGQPLGGALTSTPFIATRPASIRTRAADRSACRFRSALRRDFKNRRLQPPTYDSDFCSVQLHCAEVSHFFCTIERFNTATLSTDITVMLYS